MTRSRAPLDEAKLESLFRRTQEALLEVKAREEEFEKERHRLSVWDAVLAERKCQLDEREARVAREESELQKHAEILLKLREAIEEEEVRMRKKAGELQQQKREARAPKQPVLSTLPSLPTLAPLPALSPTQPATSAPTASVPPPQAASRFAHMPQIAMLAAAKARVAMAKAPPTPAQVIGAERRVNLATGETHNQV